MQLTRFQPKGGMCAACKHKHEDCSDLPFTTMPKLSTADDGVVIVRCTWFESSKDGE